MKFRIGSARASFALVAGTILSFSCAARAQDGPLIPYTVEKGDNCDTIANKLYGDPKRFDLIHKNNPELGPPPHHLVEGSILHVPAPNADAHLSFVRKSVEIQTPAPKPGNVNDPLFRQNRVVTGESSEADLAFRDDTHLVMGEHTLVVILGASHTKVRQGDATLVNGSLRSRLSELAGQDPPKPVHVMTDSGDVTLGAGETQVTVDETKTMRLAVYRGSASISAQHKVTVVPHEFGSKAEVGKAPTPPRPLPPAPAWVNVPPSFFLARGAAANLVASYAPGTGAGPAAAEFHVQIARDAAFKDPVVDTRVPARVIDLSAQQLPSGVYFSRVSAIDADKFEGLYSAVAESHVATVADAPAAAEGGAHHASLSIGLSGVACAVDDGDLAPVAAPIAVVMTRDHRLKCALASATSNAMTIDLPPDHLALAVAKAHLVQPDRSKDEGEIVLDLVDGNQKPVENADVVLSAPPGIAIGAPKFVAPGSYTAKVRWLGSTQSIVFGAHANGTEDANSDPVPIDRPAPVVKDRVRFEIAASVGANVADGTAGPALSGAIGIGVPLSSSLELALGARVGYEHYGAPSDIANAPAPSLVDLALPISLRYRFGRTPIGAYVTIEPQVAESTANGSTNARRGFGGKIGVQLHLGPGAIFLEGGYRGFETGTHDGTPTPNGPGVALGYRFSL